VLPGKSTFGKMEGNHLLSKINGKDLVEVSKGPFDPISETMKKTYEAGDLTKKPPQIFLRRF
jgi:hypothetical protein